MDSASMSYNPSLDSIEVQINPRFNFAVDLSQFDELLNRPPPVLSSTTLEWNYDTRLEKDALKFIRESESKASEKALKEDAEIEEYLRLKAEEKAESERLEKEKKEKEEEEARLKAIEEEEEAFRKAAEAREKELSEEEQQNQEEEATSINEEEVSPVVSQLESLELKQDEDESSENQQQISSDENPENRESNSPPATSTPQLSTASVPAVSAIQVITSVPTVSTIQVITSAPTVTAIPAITSVPTLSTTSTLPSHPRNEQKPKRIFNFSEFEAESDPFDSTEMRTISNSQALASIFGPAPASSSTSAQVSTVSTSTTNTSSTQFNPYQQHQAQQQPAMGHHQQQMQQFYRPQQGLQQFYQQPPPTGYATPPNFAQQRFPQFHPNFAQPYSRGSVGTPTNLPYHQAHQQTQPMKSSKSFGDLHQAVKDEEIQPQQSLSTSKTPPSYQHYNNQSQNENRARARSATRSPAALANSGAFFPEQPQPKPQQEDSPRKRLEEETRKQENEVLKSLENESQRNACRQVHEMGFPLERAVAAVRILDGSTNIQRILNLCLLVVKLKEEAGEGVDAEDVEASLRMKSIDEKEAGKHLKSFKKLKEFGFQVDAIHTALVRCDGDHDKALEQLLK